MKRIWWKKILSLTFAMGMCLLPLFSHGHFTSRLYCKLSDETVRIYLFQEEWTYKCQSYLAIFQKHLQEHYSELIQIMNVLNRGDDFAYWKGLFEEKKEAFLKLFKLRQRIETAVEDFGNAFLERSQNFLAPALQQKLDQLKAQKEDIQHQLLLAPSEYLNQKLAALEALEQTIFVLQKTSNIDHFIKAFDGYFMLLKKM